MGGCLTCFDCTFCHGKLGCKWSEIISCGGLLKLAEIALGAIALMLALMAYAGQTEENNGEKDFEGNDYALAFIVIVSMCMAGSFVHLVLIVCIADCLVHTTLKLLGKLFNLVACGFLFLAFILYMTMIIKLQANRYEGRDIQSEWFEAIIKNEKIDFDFISDFESMSCAAAISLINALIYLLSLCCGT